MRYRVVVPRKVQKRLDKIPQPYQGKIKLVLAWLESNPYIGKKLTGAWKGEWSYRVGPFRIVYRIKQVELVVLVIDIGDRKDVYG